MDQLFRVVALSYVDWQETMRVKGALDPVQVEKAGDLWEQMSSSFGNHLPAGCKRVITQGLTLTADATGGSQTSSVVGDPDMPAEEGQTNPVTQMAENEKPFETGTEGNQGKGKPPKGGSGSKPIIEYQKLHQTLTKTEKAITTTLKTENTALKNTLKAQTRALETLSDNVKALEGGVAQRNATTRGTSDSNMDVEAEIRGLKASVQSLSNVLKTSEAQVSKMCEKVDLLLQDKSRMTWEEFSQRQKDIMSLNQSLAAPMQSSRWSHPSPSGMFYMYFTL